MNYKNKIEDFYNKLLSVDNKITQKNLSEDKWSLKQIIGHLIDSASNNHQRLVRLQFSDLLDFPAYQAEEWVRVQNYNSMDWKQIVSLWYSYNCLLINIIENTKEDKLQNIWVVDEDTTVTLEENINQYFEHLELHIEHFNNRLAELLKEV